MKKISFLGVIPARGGSKGIPRKNIKKIAGRPLIAWTIEAARRSKLLDRFVVSTEDEEIARIAKRYGAEVIKRPKRLATDRADTLSVLQHVLSRIESDAAVVLQPTSPVRNTGRIDSCIRRFKKTGADNLATGFICKFKEYGTYDKRRQDIKGFFYDDGNVYIIKSALIRHGNRYGGKTERMITTRQENVEIDDEFDFWLAEQALVKRMKEKKD